MHLKLLLIIAAVASPPPASAIFIPDADLGEVGAGPEYGPALMMIHTDGQHVDEEEAGSVPSDGDVSITNLMVPADGNEPPVDGEVSITTTTGNLIDDEGAVQPIPELYQDSLLVGPTWTATKYYDANEVKLVDVAEGSTITIEFEDDGRLDGHAGCNDYFGSFGFVPSSITRSNTNSESSLTIAGPLGSTMMMCEETLMEQEAAYLSNLEGTIKFSVSQDGSLLELTDAERDIVVAEYTLFTPLILDQTWTATKYYISKEDGLVDVIPGSIVTLTMEVDERFEGSAGCNTYIGTYDDLTSTSFAIAAPVGSTKMLCDKPENVMEQELLYLENFEDGRTMEWGILDDGSLELRDSDSDVVIALYTAGLDVAADPLSASGGMAIGTGTAVAAFAMVTVLVSV